MEHSSSIQHPAGDLYSPLLLHEDQHHHIVANQLPEVNAHEDRFSFQNRDEAPSKSNATLAWFGECIHWEEVKMQGWLAGPMIIVNLLTLAVQLISVMFVGHCGKLELSSASIASSFSAVTGYSMLLGMGCALETLCGQAYGAGQYHLLGIYLQRAIFVLNVTSIPLAFIWANVEPLLLVLGQDPTISSKAGVYALWLIPSLFAYASEQPLIRFLQSQSLVMPLVYISFITLCFHVPICWFMVYKSGLGYEGAALAASLSNWISTLLLAAYVIASRTCEKTRAPLSLEALRELKGFFKLAIPSAAMICLEWWSYEVLVILSGLLPNPELQTSALSICISTSSLAFMIPYGLSSAASTRISNEIGAGCPRAARSAVNVALGLGASEALIISTTLLLLSNIWGKAYSNDKEVIEYVGSLVPFLAVSTFLDSLQAVLSGVVRGAGWQEKGAYINLAAYYIAGLPTGCVLAFVAHLAGKGLLVGIICGSLVQFCALATITCLSKWEKEANQAAARVGTYLPSNSKVVIGSSSEQGTTGSCHFQKQRSKD